MSAHSEGLERIGQRYAGRRTVEARFVLETIAYAQAALSEREHQHDIANQRVVDAHDREIARLNRHHETAEAAIRSRDAEIRTLKARLSNVRQANEVGEEAVEVVFAAPESQHGHPRSWNIGELEDICHRLRVAGAEDYTQVEVKHRATSASVPFPELLPTQRRQIADLAASVREHESMLPTNGEQGPPNLRAWLAFGGLGVALLVVCLILTITI